MNMALSANSAIPAGVAYRRKALDALPPEVSKHAAGVLFVAPDGDVLLLRRSAAEENFAGHWALPGGGVEEGETPRAGAARETKEETGFDAAPDRFKPLDRKITPTGLAFHTFAQPVDSKFVPTLNDEHAGFCWSSLDMLPRPLHPAVEQMLKDQVGVADDMKPEDWKCLRDGFRKWTEEEESEPEHIDVGATDSALKLALDRDMSVREYDQEGRLHVSEANVCMECISPYRGEEIPSYKELGLDPDQIYLMYRPGEEIEKAAPTMNGIPILREHIPTSAEDHKFWETIGATGTTARWEAPFLKNGLSIWPEKDINLIESKKKYALSPGYRYKAVMEPGTFDGKPFAGRMIGILFNHLCVVSEGRQGDDVVIGDADPFDAEWSIVENAILGLL